jgi:hypothetical protein
LLSISSCLVIVALAAAACAPRALVALPSTAAEWIDDFSARATTSRGVTVEARTRGWPGDPLDLDKHATPIFVRIENGGSVPLRLSRDSFELVAGTATFRTLPPDQIGAARADLRRRELRQETLGPGESDSGFLYFEPVEGKWGFPTLRTLLVDASSGALLDSVDVPFSSGYVVSCTLDRLDRQEAWSGENLLFHTCLPPP